MYFVLTLYDFSLVIFSINWGEVRRTEYLNTSLPKCKIKASNRKVLSYKPGEVATYHSSTILAVVLRLFFVVSFQLFLHPFSNTAFIVGPTHAGFVL